MAYFKLQKMIQDAMLGFQTVNKADANLDLVYDSWALQHTVERPRLGESVTKYQVGGSATRFIEQNNKLSMSVLGEYGKHNTVLVPLAAAYFTPDTAYAYAPAIGDYTVLRTFPTGAVLGNAIRISTGVYLIPLNSTATNVWAEATPWSVAITPVLVNARIVFGADSAVQGPAVRVDIHELISGEFGPSNSFGASVAVYGE